MRKFNRDGSIPRSLLRGWMPPTVIGAKPLSVIPRSLPRGGFIAGKAVFTVLAFLCRPSGSDAVEPNKAAIAAELNLDALKTIAVVSGVSPTGGTAFERGAMRELLEKGYRVVTTQNREFALTELRRIESAAFSRKDQPSPGQLKIAPYILVINLSGFGQPPIFSSKGGYSPQRLQLTGDARLLDVEKGTIVYVHAASISYTRDPLPGLPPAELSELGRLLAAGLPNASKMDPRR